MTQHDWEVFIAVLLAKTRDGQKEREREREKKMVKFDEIWIDLEDFGRMHGASRPLETSAVQPRSHPAGCSSIKYDSLENITGH